MYGVNQMIGSIFMLSHLLQWHYCGLFSLCKIIVGLTVALKLSLHVDFLSFIDFPVKSSYLICS